MRRAFLLLLSGVLFGACSESTPPAQAPASPAAEAVSAQPALCEHQVPADQCTRCIPDLIAVFKELGDWCAEHELPESHCRKCNPALSFAQPSVPADWCREHAVPESMCTKCNPSLVSKFVEAGDYCREHGVPESVCPWCNPELEAPTFPAPGTVIRLKTARTADEAGIQTAQVRRGPFTRTLEVVGRLSFDQNRLAQLSARGEALIIEVMADVGDEVKSGEPLAVLASGEVGAQQARLDAAKARLDAAQANLRREEGLVARGISPKKSLDEAQAEVAAAQGALDAARAALKASGASGGTGGRYVLTAPFSGTVVRRDAVVGRYASEQQVLFELADLTTMWAQLDVPEEDAGWVRPGQAVQLRLEGSAHAPIDATLTRVSPSVDPHTRTVRARVELPNRDRTLKDGAFLRAKVAVSAPREVLKIPIGAVQTAEETRLVFVRTGDGVYQPRRVELGARTEGEVEIRSGLEAGEEVVTTGAFLLKTELVRDDIGAGCCEVPE